MTVRCNEERMQPMSTVLIVIIDNLCLLQRRDNAAYVLNARSPYEAVCCNEEIIQPTCYMLVVTVHHNEEIMWYFSVRHNEEIMLYFFVRHNEEIMWYFFVRHNEEIIWSMCT